MRVRGLKLYGEELPSPNYQSHPMRVRGLKPYTLNLLSIASQSHPMRVRGLKHDTSATLAKTNSVAPHAGAWIETHPPSAQKPVSSRTPCGCVD